MKDSKKYWIIVTCFIGAIVCFVSVQLKSMKSTEFTIKSGRTIRPVKRIPIRYKSEMVWIKTSDNQIIEMPLWYVDQMKVLHLLFLQQKGKNSKNNPLHAFMVSSNALTLLQMALKNATDHSKLELFCNGLTPEEKTLLVNSSSELEAQGLLSLLMQAMYPAELGMLISNAGVLEPVINYLDPLIDQKILIKNSIHITCVLFSHDGTFIVSGGTGTQNNLIIWDGVTGQKKSILQGHPLWVRSLDISFDDQFIISGGSSAKDNLILWDRKTGGKKSLIGHNGWVNCVQFSPYGQYIVSGGNGDKNNVIVWNGKTGEQITILEGHPTHVNCVAFSPDGECIISGCNGDQNNLILWHYKTGEKIVLQGHNGNVSCVNFSHDGKYIISGSQGEFDNLILWDAKTGELLQKLHGHDKFVLCAEFSPDDEYIISCCLSDQNNLILWDTHSRKKIKILEGHDTGVNCARFSFDGNFIASGAYGQQNNLILWDGKTGRLIRICKGHEQNVWSIAFHPDTISLASGAFCKENAFMLLSLMYQKAFDFIVTHMNIAQARFLYRLYWAQLNNVTVLLEKNDPDYQTYITLPYNVQQLIATYFSFKIVDAFEIAVQKKINNFKMNFAKMRATYDEKINTIKIFMKDFDKDSVEYEACKRLLVELEEEEAFKEI